MLVFHYDKSFDGLLSAVFDAYTEKTFPERLIGDQDSLPMLATGVHRVLTGEEKSARVAAGLARLLSKRALSGLMYAWMSDEEGADLAVFRYIRMTFDRRRSPENDLADPVVFAVAALAKKVLHEAHQLSGFIRFQKTAQGVYFASLAPRHNILTLLIPHFRDRFADQRWILYDLKRRYGFLYDGHEVRDVFLEPEQADRLLVDQGKLAPELLAENELIFQDLWKTYFKAIAIEERRNPRLQARLMPRRFWKYLTEKQE